MKKILKLFVYALICVLLGIGIFITPEVQAQQLKDKMPTAQNGDKIKVIAPNPMSKKRADLEADLSQKYAATITAEDLRKHLMILAGDEYEGRGTGQKGQEKAAKYITKHFEDLKMPPIGDGSKPYRQKVELTTQKWGEPTIKIKDKTYTFLKDFYAFVRGSSRADYTTDEVLFLGYGIDDPKYNDYKGAKVKGKTVMVLASEPMKKNGKYYISGDDEPSEWSSNWRKKIEVAREKGVKTLLIVTQNVETQARRFGPYVSASGMQVKALADAAGSTNTIYISIEMAQKILGKKRRNSLKKLQSKIDKKGKSKKVKTTTKTKINLDLEGDDITSYNLLGYIKGSDPKLKDELVIITAHYDHLGVKGEQIYYGADDDGSGTVSVLEIAEAFAKAKEEGNGPKRSVLIMPVTAEEKGLLGSKYYTDVAPQFPLKNTVVNLNLDMVGRIDDLHDNGNYVYVIGSDKLSTELHEINERSNKKYTQLELDYKYNDDNDPNRFYYRSDHYNFAKNNIPIIFYFNGTHADYHQTSDTPDKIEYEVLQNRARLVFHTAWQIANQEKRIVADKAEKQ